MMGSGREGAGGAGEISFPPSSTPLLSPAPPSPRPASPAPAPGPSQGYAVPPLPINSANAALNAGANVAPKRDRPLRLSDISANPAVLSTLKGTRRASSGTAALAGASARAPPAARSYSTTAAPPLSSSRPFPLPALRAASLPAVASGSVRAKGRFMRASVDDGGGGRERERDAGMEAIPEVHSAVAAGEKQPVAAKTSLRRKFSSPPPAPVLHQLNARLTETALTVPTQPSFSFSRSSSGLDYDPGEPALSFRPPVPFDPDA